MKIKNLFKKVIITMCSSAMLMGIGAVGVNAAEVTEGDFTISRSKSGYSSPYVVSVSAYKGEGGAITLPTSATINDIDYSITSVGAAFTGNVKITDVTIPEGYDTIDVSAFEGCTNLKSVTIPGSMTMISSSAFKDCPNLETITFTDDTASSLSVKNDIFANCTSLTSINLPKRLSSASNNFLRGCTALTSISIADGAEKFTVSDNVLYDVSEDTAAIVAYPFGKTETEFTIPTEINNKTVAEIAMHLFRENGTLKKITVPDTVTTIGGFAFNDMTAVQEIVLEQTDAAALTLGSYAFVGLPSGSKIIVKNDDVANKIKSGSYYYTPDNTTITVASSEPETKTVSAAFSIAAEPKIKDGKAVYGIYLDSAENVNTVLLQVSFDLTKVGEGEINSAIDNFTIITSNWTEENGKLVLKAYLGILNNVTGFTSTDKTKLAEITVPLKDGAKGNITAEISKAPVGGVVGEDESAMKGTVTIATSSASVFIPSYDVNGDGTVDIIDITEAQRYYQAKSTDANWEEKAKAMDVNGDNKVDIQDYIDIFNNLSDF